ncbi:MAG: hypothetical protein R2697_06890 [Ilumatobacteraceae bacterium]
MGGEPGEFGPFGGERGTVGEHLVAHVLGTPLRRDGRGAGRLGVGQFRHGGRLAVASVPRLVAGVDQFGAQHVDLVAQLDGVGTESFDHLVALGHRLGEHDDLGAGPSRDLFGGSAPLLGALEGLRRGGLLGLGVGGRGESGDVVGPTVGSGEPQAADLVDEFGDGTAGDARAELVVALDGPDERGQHRRRDALGVEVALERSRIRERRLDLLPLAGDQHGVLDRGAQVSRFEVALHRLTVPPSRHRARDGSGSRNPWSNRCS